MASERLPQKYVVAVTVYAAAQGAGFNVTMQPQEIDDPQEAQRIAQAVGGDVQALPNLEDQVITLIMNPGVKKGELFVAPDGSLTVGCSHCGQGMSLGPHRMVEGKVKPSIICPTCGAHYWAGMGASDGG